MNNVGLNFSHRQIAYLGIDVKPAFEAFHELGYSYLRLSCYWEEIEVKPGVYDFQYIQQLLKLCEKKSISVLLTLGMKAPRWPEFYPPEWVKLKAQAEQELFLLKFLAKSIDVLSHFECITHWQVENEPLDPSGEKRQKISYELLQREVELVREKDSRPIVITIWGNDLTKITELKKIDALADVIGIDLYYKQALGPFFMRGPLLNDQKLGSLLQGATKPYWITELQGEPWEQNYSPFDDKNPRTFSASDLETNYNRALLLDPQVIFFWGFEYWLFKKLHGDSTWFDTAKEIRKKNSLKSGTI